MTDLPVTITTEKELALIIIARLNSILGVDRTAITELLRHRTPCNDDLANHDTVQVGLRKGGYSLSALGLLNGLVGVQEAGWGYIGSVHKTHCPRCDRKTKVKPGGHCLICNSEVELRDIEKFILIDPEQK